jgi:predicted nucleotidyltransferase
MKGITKATKQAFIDEVVPNSASFLALKDYNAAKKYRYVVRSSVDGDAGRLVENGQHILNIMEVTLDRLNDSMVKDKCAYLQAEHRAKKQAKSSQGRK